VLILSKLNDKIGPIVDGISERLDILEDQILSPDFVDDRNELMQLRQRAIMLYRHIKPQTDVLIDLSRLEHDLFDKAHLRSFYEAVNRNQRFVAVRFARSDELAQVPDRTHTCRSRCENEISIPSFRKLL